LQDVFYVSFPGRSLFLPGKVTILAPRRSVFLPEEASIPSRGDQYSFPSGSAFSSGARVPVASPAFARRKFSFAGAFAVVVTLVPVGDTTGFSGVFPRRSVFLPERISISDERGYSPKCVEEQFSEVQNMSPTVWASSTAAEESENPK
jgi:hypothetical protein